jgi:hypothetical protein
VECKNKVIPIITQSTGTISESFRKYLSNIAGKHKIKELQKTAILDTARILEKVVTLKYRRFNIGSIIISTMNSNYRIAATLSLQET